jgi:hypothetical protein
MQRFVVLLITALFLAACSRTPQPPVGRWIGNYESSGVMVDAWLEILPDGTVRICAPDILNVGAPSDEDRTAMHAKLAADLSDAWNEVKLRSYDFDGHVFRKPGGIAPQMEWDARTRQMKLVFYIGMQHSIRINMHAVNDFTEDSWATP